MTDPTPAATLRDGVLLLLVPGPLSAGELAHLTRQLRSNVRNAASKLLLADKITCRKTKTNKNRGGVLIYALPGTTDEQWRAAIERVKKADDAQHRDWFPKARVG